MSKFLKNIIGSFLSFSSKTPFGYKMVRYFPNTFEDYQPDSPVSMHKDGVILSVTEHIDNIKKRLKPGSHNVDGGLYCGISGVSYMFYYLSKNPALSQKKAEYLEKGIEYLLPAMKTSCGDRTSFLLGDAGTFVIAAAIQKEQGDEQYKQSVKAYKSLFNQYLNPKFLKCGGNEFFVGRTGYIVGALWLSREIKETILSNSELHKICDMMVESGREYSIQTKSSCPLMYHYYNTEYLGAAHGIGFILQTLLSVPGYLNTNDTYANYIKQSIDFLLSLQLPDGNWPCCMEEIGMAEHKLVHWCHGAPGIVYLMAKAYLVYKEEKYLNSCILAADLVWEKGLLLKGPGICHGVAGSGYVFFLLFRLTLDKKYLYRAKVFADFMNSEQFLQEARVPDHPQSLYEGIAGTVCFLADLLQPDVAEFPFQDVFSNYVLQK